MKSNLQSFDLLDVEKTSKNDALIVTQPMDIFFTFQVILQLFLCLQSSGFLKKYVSEEIFGNITELFVANDSIWVSYISSVITNTRLTKNEIKPSDVFKGFVRVG